MRFLSLCSGIEAASQAWAPLGWEAAAFSEIEPFPCALLKHHYPSVPNLGDVSKITREQVEALGPLDLVCGGFPCQDLSNAGKRAGLKDADGNQTRSGLFFDAMRVVGWARARWLVIENVPGMLSSSAGRDFAAVVGAMAGCEFGVPPDGWANPGAVVGPLGLVEWATLDAQFFGLAQRRKRVFLVRDSGDWASRPPVLLERESLRGDPAPRREAGARVAACLTRGAESGGKGGYAGRRQEDDVNIVAGTLSPGAHPGGYNGQDAFNGLLVPQTARTLAASDGGIDREDRHTLLAFGGNNTSGPINVSSALSAHGGTGRNDFESETFVVHTLRGDGFDASEDGTGRGTPLVAVDIRNGTLGGPAHTIQSAGLGDERGGNPNAIPHVLAFDTTQITSAANRSNPQAGDPCHPPVAGGHALAIAFNARQDPINGPINGPIDTDGGSNGLMHGAAVRRLTVRECLRLQGFHDDYLDIQFRGKPAADGPKYKAIGNSWAVNVAAWVGRRIQLVEEISKGRHHP